MSKEQDNSASIDCNVMVSVPLQLSAFYYLHAALILGCMAACLCFVVQANWMAALFFYFLSHWPNSYAAHYMDEAKDKVGRDGFSKAVWNWSATRDAWHKEEPRAAEGT